MNQLQRGGPQRIPRPDNWTPGNPAPWLHATDVDLDTLERRLLTRTSGYQQTGAPPPKRHSAVLIALYSDPEPTVVLTRRTQQMKAHSGEVSFPGGGQDPGESLWDTACREAREEIQLDTTLARRIGELDHLTTVSSQARIVPYVARLSQPPSMTANPDEVDEILLVSLSELLLPEVYREERWQWPGSNQQRPIYFFDLFGDTVWGATANLLRQLLVTALGLPEHEK
ncbi:MAG TPA: CoA pyrophosphatase [Acidimicrobiia bacterium]|nr:CoA pyrophosphatase [Acidimicrobiia bacterium]HIL04661.1 CoA pyrophosphatase [Acidimicrobiia bacterium]